MIIFDNVTKQYPDGSCAIRNISLTFGKGEFSFVVGKSGAGKTTLLRMITRELRPSKGKIQVGEIDITSIPGRKVPQLRRRIGTIFQDFKLLADRTVEENVGIPLAIQGTPKAEISTRVAETLKKVGLSEKAKFFPAQLSGGEAQRTAFARAIVHKPLILLADEPTGDLDAVNADILMELLNDYHNDGVTVIMATHNAGIVNKMKRRVVQLDEGKLLSDVEEGIYAI
ncbi:MAG: cell division ATP-binding protein FtsE [bacterium]|nr:cell division ATP-binding protein FtsE [bacterium]